MVDKSILFANLILDGFTIYLSIKATQLSTLTLRQLENNTWKSQKLDAMEKPLLLLTHKINRCSVYEIKLISVIGNARDQKQIYRLNKTVSH